MTPIAALSLIQPLPQHASWQKAPDIIICTQINLPQSHVGQSLTLWKELGYAFSIVYWNYEGSECQGGYIDNAIIITSKQTRRGPKAHTFARISQTHKRMIAARIEITPESAFKKRILIHELGHALGWSHSDVKGHMMHPIYQLGGWDTTGLLNPNPIHEDLLPERK